MSLIKSINPTTFPVCLICINLLSSLVYFKNGMYFKCIYWIAAATLTFVVTFDQKTVINIISDTFKNATEFYK
jgi:hypothetical protein